MSQSEYIEWAKKLIEQAIEIMTLDQLAKWDGVRAWQETEVER